MHVRPRSGSTFVVATVLITAVFALAATAQEADDAPEPGILFFTSQDLNADDSSLDCGDMPHYNLTREDQRDNESSQAPASVSYGAVACPTFFEHNVSEPFELKTNASVAVHFGCESDTVLRNAAGQSTVRVTVQKNGEDVDGATGSWTSPDELCTPDDSPYYAAIVIESIDASFEAGDILGLEALIWSSDTAGGEVYYSAGSPNNSSLIRAAGLPDPTPFGNASIPTAEDFEIALDPDTVGVAPGDKARVKATLVSNASQDAEFSWAVEGLPAGVTAEFDPSNGTVDAGENATSNLTLEIDDGVAEGEHRLFVNATFDGGVNATSSLIIAIAADDGGTSGTGNATITPFPDDEDPGDDGDNDREDNGNHTQLEDEGGDSPGTGLVIGLLALAAAGLAMAHRRRS
jgi:MYXO-CTERM domain-containing protein